MRFDLSNDISVKKAETRFDYLKDKKARIDLTEKKPIRSYSQNNYLHLILSAFGLHFGYSLQEVKQYIFKEIVNKELFYDGQKQGIAEVPEWRSTARLDTKELSTAIERFLNYSAKHGYRLPEPSDLAWIEELEMEVLSNQKYL